MNIRYPTQLVHDIEYGYGDPLRTKVTPEFSIRLMDESYAAENKTISKIQDVMVEYFRKRNGPMAKDGISALQKSLAAIYYLPFQCGVNLYFRFSGQSIPNRSEVRHKEGVKIYFDPSALQPERSLLASWQPESWPAHQRRTASPRWAPSCGMWRHMR
ncbi:hypothetical protein CVIRNUC_005841 [Coccomyxa viridis]|uniref:DUF7897 domain-containing protein n=1 Tax=Coccomyxa viridis TaxID=1274662 RepID=A0AAV1I780_9CHLO|nr:hypothetical protein CVIRNUC_005841 [Coccomyxa viridis]